MNTMSRRALLSVKYALQKSGVRGRLKGKEVVFVAGVQRSGTNMIMEVLERSYDTSVFNDWDCRAFDKYELRSPGVIHSLVDNERSDSVAFKILLDIQCVNKLLAEYNPAKVVWIVRDYRDVVNSHRLKWRNMSKMIGCIIEGRNSVGWRGRGLSDDLLEEIGEYYYPDMSEESACALFWYYRNSLYFEQGLDEDTRALVVGYEKLVSRPEEIFPEVFGFLGLKYSQRVTAKVFSTSIGKSLSPKIDPVIGLKCSALMDRFSNCNNVVGSQR